MNEFNYFKFCVDEGIKIRSRIVDALKKDVTMTSVDDKSYEYIASDGTTSRHLQIRISGKIMRCKISLVDESNSKHYGAKIFGIDYNIDTKAFKLSGGNRGLDLFDEKLGNIISDVINN